MSKYITLKEENILKDIAFKVIKDENLPHLEKIKFQSPLNGMRKRGTCQCKINNFTGKRSNYRIYISTVDRKFIDDLNGTYINKKTKKLRKRVIGEPHTFKSMVNTMGHEIAHMKFFRHGKRHTNYTDIIINKLYKKLEELGHSSSLQ